MSETTWVTREQKRLEIQMNVDDNFHVCMLRGRNLPNDMWSHHQRQISRQNNRGKQKPGIAPRVAYNKNWEKILLVFKASLKCIGKCLHLNHQYQFLYRYQTSQYHIFQSRTNKRLVNTYTSN